MANANPSAHQKQIAKLKRKLNKELASNTTTLDNTARQLASKLPKKSKVTLATQGKCTKAVATARTILEIKGHEVAYK